MEPVTPYFSRMFEPVRKAMLARDPEALIATFAPDIELRSPVTARPFRGREEVGELMTELLAALDGLEYREVAVDGDAVLVRFRMRLRGRDVDVVDLMRFDSDGLLREVVVHARPMASVALFASIVGPRVARRRGRWQYVAALTARPLPAVLRAFDMAGARLVARRR